MTHVAGALAELLLMLSPFVLAGAAGFWLRRRFGPAQESPALPGISGSKAGYYMGSFLLGGSLVGLAALGLMILMMTRW